MQFATGTTLITGTTLRGFVWWCPRFSCIAKMSARLSGFAVEAPIEKWRGIFPADLYFWTQGACSRPHDGKPSDSITRVRQI